MLTTALSPRPLRDALDAIAEYGLPEPAGALTVRTPHGPVVRCWVDTLEQFVTYADALPHREITATRHKSGTTLAFLALTLHAFEVGYLDPTRPGDPTLAAVDLPHLRASLAENIPA